MKKVALAGTIVLDIIKKIKCWPEKGMLTNITSITNGVGGAVCNSGIDLKLLGGDGMEVLAYGRVGNDANGEWLINHMKKYGLNTDGIIVSDEPTAFTDVMTVEETGERTFFVNKGASAKFTERDINFDKLDCDIFHLGYLLLLDELDASDDEYGTRAARMLAEIQKRGIKTSIDIVSEQSDRFKKIVIPALKYCDYVIINEIEGGELTDISPLDENGEPSVERLREISKKLFELGVREIVTLHCPALSTTMSADGDFAYLPSLSLPKGYIKGAVGAGDAFCAGMLYALANGIEKIEAMRIASCAAAANLSVADSVSGARSLEETLMLEKIYNRKDI